MFATRLRRQTRKEKEAAEEAARNRPGVLSRVVSGLPYMLICGGMAGKLTYDLIDRNMDPEVFGWEDVAIALGATRKPEDDTQKRRSVVRTVESTVAGSARHSLVRQRAQVVGCSAELETRAEACLRDGQTWAQWVGPTAVGAGAFCGHQAAVFVEHGGPMQVTLRSLRRRRRSPHMPLRRPHFAG